ncbi:GntR family transcriptional regulator [Streptomyces albus subsp. albus]|nr:GntR family transcriptional regulator [Streptomyces albus subsp. albus]
MAGEVDRFRDAAVLVELLGDWTAARGPLYRRLGAALERAVCDGDLRPGDRLPAERRLARTLAVSRSTVVAAYDLLRGLGLARGIRGSGTVIEAHPRARRTAGADGRVPGGRATSVIQRLVDGPGDIISLAYAVDPGVLELADALRDLVRDDLPGLLAGAGYHPRGLPVLRQAIAAYHTARGLPTSGEQVLVTTGATQAISLAARMYLGRGATVVVESPSWPGCLDVLRDARARLVGVPLDDEGIRVDGLARALAEERPALLYVMPTFHNPTGVLMSAGRRRRIAELAARYGVPLLEDNAYGATQRIGEVPPPVAAWAPPGAEILTVESLGKAIWGGLRIGWVRAPAATVERLARHKALADLGGPLLDQALAARLLPELPALNATRAEVLSDRLRLVRALLARHLPDWRCATPDGGAALWIDLPGTDARVFAQVALRHGVEVVPGATMDPEGRHDSYIRLPYAFPADLLTEAVHRLAAAWAELRRHEGA